MSNKIPSIRWLNTLGIKDVPIVGGKNASLGEMLCSLAHKGIKVPDGFATTSQAYWDFLKENQLDKKFAELIAGMKKKKIALEKVGASIRQLIMASNFPPDIVEEIIAAYRLLNKKYRQNPVDVAVRSSATAEDLPSASFAGQQETFLNIRGEKQLLQACKRCYASLFTDRAIAYREAKGFDHLKTALSIGVQKMVRSDKACAGVMFTVDTETGFPQVVVINASWGLGENVVQGSVTPDEYVVFKPLLGQKNVVPLIEKKLGLKEKKMIYGKDGKHAVKNIKTTSKERSRFVLNEKEIMQLASWGMLIEQHYKRAMDIEWAKDGVSGDLFIVQARPETVQSQKKGDIFKTYILSKRGTILCQGPAIGEAIVSGKAQVIKHLSDIGKFETGSILVTEMTSPDWVPIMQRAAAIITDRGGRTSHAAIVSRELGVSAIVGTNKGTKAIKDGEWITVSCAEGDQGYVYRGNVPYREQVIHLEKLPKFKTKIMMNIASPQAAFRWWRLPCVGIGLARMEFIINDIIQIHPMALLHLDQVKDPKAKKKILELTKGYRDKREYFIDHLARGIAKIAASRYPFPVIVRMSDFKTNEYAHLIGGQFFEPKEENPMLGFRGASRYYNPRYREGFALECAAIKRVRETLGLSNVIVMIPFCRTLEEADHSLAVLAENGLKRKRKGLQVYVMAEIPSNILLASEFADRFDGFSIGSNDLTQLVLGIDRDSEELSSLFDERNEAVKKMIVELIDIAHRKKRTVGICGQAPSDYPEFAAFLIKQGIDSISLNPDSIPQALRRFRRRKAIRPLA
jgi:pyruvate,water dikinase